MKLTAHDDDEVTSSKHSISGAGRRDIRRLGVVDESQLHLTSRHRLQCVLEPGERLDCTNASRSDDTPTTVPTAACSQARHSEQVTTTDPNAQPKAVATSGHPRPLRYATLVTRHGHDPLFKRSR